MFDQQQQRDTKNRRNRPPHNPYNTRRSTNTKNTSTSSRKQSKTFSSSSRSTKQTPLFIPLVILLSTLLLGVWFLTPISDFVTTFVLLTVPISTDVYLGLESWDNLTTMRKNKIKVTNDNWGVQSIGADLVNSVLHDDNNLDTFCDFMIQNDGGDSSGGGGSFSFLEPFLLLKKHCKDQAYEYHWKFMVIQSSDINAFALPGGIVCVTDSLLKTLHLSRGEIAALLSHEMAHVLYRHGQSQLLKRQIFQTIVKAIFYDDQDEVDETFGEAIHEIMLKSASHFGQLKFSRMNEYEADNGAWGLLVSSKKYNPQQVQLLLEKLQSLQSSGYTSQKYDSQSVLSSVSAWDKTHPGTPERIEEMKEKWNACTRSERRMFQQLV